MTKLSDPLGRAFIEFFESQGMRFVDADTREPLTQPSAPCPKCKKDTKTLRDGTCLACGEPKHRKEDA